MNQWRGAACAACAASQLTVTQAKLLAPAAALHTEGVLISRSLLTGKIVDVLLSHLPLPQLAFAGGLCGLRLWEQAPRSHSLGSCLHQGRRSALNSVAALQEELENVLLRGLAALLVYPFNTVKNYLFSIFVSCSFYFKMVLEFLEFCSLKCLSYFSKLPHWVRSSSLLIN